VFDTGHQLLFGRFFGFVAVGGHQLRNQGPPVNTAVLLTLTPYPNIANNNPGKATNSTTASARRCCKAPDRSKPGAVVARMWLNRRIESGPSRSSKATHHASSIRRVQRTNAGDGGLVRNLPQDFDGPPFGDFLLCSGFDIPDQAAPNQ
jgi:hypothetical protein